ncbi:MAG: phosphoribosyltransferase [Nanoarchaeota archaeon]|nr:phosphoribosyltransferase [Nanoarchaeota archaeon]MBU4242004.1 phosphoribosyltransferase [Nanoarchaeota archaeon]MBU4352571.1 phosphoribosyltransferase [Nanoarchaeota archaeon]
MAKKTCNLVKSSDFHPDVIIAIARGGLVPGRLFCDFLHIKNCYSIKVDHWGLTATKNGEAKLTHALNLDLEEKKVLVVDDVTDTGQSMDLAKKHISELNPKEIKTATLFHLTGSKYTPDFFGKEREWAWIVFPWNFTEDIVNIIRKIGKDKSLEEIKKKLQENYAVSLGYEQVQEFLNHISYLEKQGK